MKSILATLAVVAGTASGAAVDWMKAFEFIPNAQSAAKNNLRVNLGNSTYGSVANCGSSSDIAQNLVVTITPESPKAGEEVTTIFEYDLISEVTGGSASYGVSLNGINFPATVNDLCADQAGGCCPDPCPLAVGHHFDKSITNFPSGVSGKIVSTIKWTDQNNKQILCVQWTVKI